MNRKEQLEYLIEYLNPDIEIPDNEADMWNFFRGLMNIRSALPVSEDFLCVQNELLQNEIAKKGITDIDNLQPVKDSIYLWQGDITTINADAIVNAANSGLTGCYYPCHGCIDNAIHTFAGVQLRLECNRIMEMQGLPEAVGKAKITDAYNLPSKYVIHTVGPIVNGILKEQDCKMLKLCYQSCLELAVKKGLSSIAFCCISTGEFHFPNQIAARIAVETVTDFLKSHNKIKVIFNVFKDADFKIYSELLN